MQKMLGQLQESGNVTTIKHYLKLLEGDFLIKGLEKLMARYPKAIPIIVDQTIGCQLLKMEELNKSSLRALY